MLDLSSFAIKAVFSNSAALSTEQKKILRSTRMESISSFLERSGLLRSSGSPLNFGKALERRIPTELRQIIPGTGLGKLGLCAINTELVESRFYCDALGLKQSFSSTESSLSQDSYECPVHV